jgi:hypothetical protein
VLLLLMMMQLIHMLKLQSITKQIDQHVWDNQRIAVGDIASEMSVSYGKKQ